MCVYCIVQKEYCIMPNSGPNLIACLPAPFPFSLRLPLTKYIYPSLSCEKNIYVGTLREKQRQRETDRDRDRQKQKGRDIQTDRQTERDRRTERHVTGKLRIQTEKVPLPLFIAHHASGSRVRPSWNSPGAGHATEPPTGTVGAGRS